MLLQATILLLFFTQLISSRKVCDDSGCLDNFDITYNEATGYFDISITQVEQSRYIGIAFGSTNQMLRAELYYCSADGLHQGTLILPTAVPRIRPKDAKNIRNVRNVLHDGKTSCYFSRPSSITRKIRGIDYFYDFTENEYYLLWARGEKEESTSCQSGNNIDCRYAFLRHGTTERGAYGRFNFTTFTSSQSLSKQVSGCGTTKACFYLPEGCNPGSPSCVFSSVSYNPDENSFDIVIIGNVNNNNGYTSVAFTSTPAMQDADLYYCTAGGIFSGAIGVRYSRPQTQSNSILTNQQTSIVNGILTCSFTRPASVSKNFGDQGTMTFNLEGSNSFYFLMATGPLNPSGNLENHGSERQVFGQTDFTLYRKESSTTTTTTISTTTTTTTTATTTTMTPALSPTASCQITKTCFYYPANCQPGGSSPCLFSSVSYNTDENSFDIVIIGNVNNNNEYTSIGFTSTPAMQNTDLYYCIAGENEVFSGIIGARYSPPQRRSNSILTNNRASTVNGILTCSFNRPASVSKNFGRQGTMTFNLEGNNSFYFLMATGRTNNGNLVYHGPGRQVFGQADFTLHRKESSTTTTATTNTRTPALSPTASCQITKTCFYYPANCQPGGSSPCLFSSVSYNPDENSFDIVIIGNVNNNNGYTSVAFTSTPAMQDADQYYCIAGENEVFSGIIGARYRPPQRRSNSILINHRASTVNGILTCSFTRPASVSKNFGDRGTMTFNLEGSNSFYFLMATGRTNNGNLGFHGVRRNRQVFGQTDFTRYRKESSTTTTTTTATTITMTPALSPTASCQITKTCFYHPANCQPGGSSPCLFSSVSYNPNENSFDIVIIGNVNNNGYTSVAFTRRPGMQDADLYYCIAGEDEVFSGIIGTRYSRPQTQSNSILTNNRASTVNGILTCSFTRPASVSKNFGRQGTMTFNLEGNNSFYFLMATGRTTNGVLQRHGRNGRAVRGPTNFTALRSPVRPSK